MVRLVDFYGSVIGNQCTYICKRCRLTKVVAMLRYGSKFNALGARYKGATLSLPRLLQHSPTKFLNQSQFTESSVSLRLRGVTSSTPSKHTEAKMVTGPLAEMLSRNQ
jgi:hypothetical protein